MNKKAQIGGRELIGLLVIGVILIVVLPILTAFLNSVSSGNIESSFDAIVNAFIPLMIIAVFFEFIRRFLK